MVDAARKEGRPLDHIMFSGPPGLGKTTMAKALANEMGAHIEVVTGPELKDRESLQSVLAKMEDGDILFIDEIHALPQKVDEMMFPIMEDGEMDVQIEGRGTFRVKTPDITFLGATTNPEGVAKPLRDRFGAVEQLSYYKDAELAEIVKVTAAKKGLDIGSDVANAIASRSRGTPRIANRLVRRVNDYISARGGTLDMATTDKVLNLWDIDARGLSSEDRRVMGSLQDLGTAGINTLSASTGLDETTISSVVEPYLLRQGFINRTPKGRTLTQAGIMHLDTYGRDDLGDFEVAKRLGGVLASFSAPIEIAKSDKRQNLVFGWANVTFDKGNQVVDHQGHMIDVEELESAAYNFAVKYRKTGDDHKGEGFGELVESLIVTEDKIAKGGFPEDMLGKWWIGFRVPPEDWDKVERGERSMFSIQGRAQLEAV
jgi:Holliday junction DNA helicase RuvB